MSNYRALAWNPNSEKLEVAEWHDYGTDGYDVVFSDGTRYHDIEVRQPGPVDLFLIAQEMAEALETAAWVTQDDTGLTATHATLIEALVTWQKFTNPNDAPRGDITQAEAMRLERDGWRRVVGEIAAGVPLPDTLLATGSVRDLTDYITNGLRERDEARALVRELVEALREIDEMPDDPPADYPAIARSARLKARAAGYTEEGE